MGACVAAALLALPLLAAAAIFVSQNLYDGRQAEAFGKIALGMNEAEVVALAGDPLDITDGSIGPSGHLEPERYRTAGCTREIWYGLSYSFFPSKWSYCFDNTGALTSKYHHVSW